jgi:esterase
MSLPLASLRFENSSAPALVILHGLLGSARNWTTIGRALQERFDVHALDLRNHGSSPHAESMRWPELVADLERYLEDHGLNEIHLIGHSLGGKIAMRFACEQPDVVKKLVVVDIAAKAYPPYHDNKFKAMKRIPTAELTSRKEADELLTPMVEDWAMRQFLLTSLVRNGESGFKWQINLEALHASLPTIRLNSFRDGARYEGPSLLVIGGKSDFIQDGDLEHMREWLPQIESVTVPNAGHNVHVEDRKGFLQAISGWL